MRALSGATYPWHPVCKVPRGPINTMTTPANPAQKPCKGYALGKDQGPKALTGPRITVGIRVPWTRAVTGCMLSPTKRDHGPLVRGVSHHEHGSSTDLGAIRGPCVEVLDGAHVNPAQGPCPRFPIAKAPRAHHRPCGPHESCSWLLSRVPVL